MLLECKVKATEEEMESCFSFDEVLNIRSYEQISPGLYFVRIRLPECKGIRTTGISNLEKIRKKVIRRCPDSFRVVGDANYANKKTRRIYAPNEFWLHEYANIYGREFGSRVLSIRQMAG